MKCIGRLHPLPGTIAAQEVAHERDPVRPEALHRRPADDHALAVFAGAWLPGRGAPPHNHGTWAVVAGVVGRETNVFWRRTDDGSRPGYAAIVKAGEKVFGPGDVVTFLPDSIHSVTNDTDAVAVSLHVYGTHVNYTTRWQFDPETRIAREFKVTQTI